MTDVKVMPPTEPQDKPDWRGEDLIRAPKCAPTQARATVIQPMSHLSIGGRKCGVEGCAKAISVVNKTGVCRGHIHSKPYCACPLCQGFVAKEAVNRLRKIPH
jgi:hypothetical protein